ncbi:MAG TPA: hypothetical protein PKA96_03125, partial [Candidatus Paceibacterota bacterium]|nr:hypothetical protein [Candidatus Paceibacterota bacterium]
MKQFPNPFGWLKGYNLQNEEKVVKNATKQSRTEQDPSILRDHDKRIEAYLSKLENFFKQQSVTEDSKHQHQPNEAGERYKYLILKHFVTDRQDIPESYFIYKTEYNRVHGITEPINREQEKDRIISEQQNRISEWFDYLTQSENNPYTTDFKYFVMSNVLKLGSITPEHTFPKRTKSTTEPIPELDREALAYVFDAINSAHKNIPNPNTPDFLIQLVKSNASFDKLYGQTIKHLDKEKHKDIENIKGEWITFTNPDKLVQSLYGKRSYLCIAQDSHAKKYINNGPVILFFSEDEEGNNTIPRVAIATNKSGQVYEVRGTYNANEDIDPYITDTLEAKLNTLPNGDNSKQKIHDSRMLLSVKVKSERKKPLNKEELRFIYQLDRPIEIFGYQQSRNDIITEILNGRDINADLPILFDCT